jgi:hypothetical protein
LARARALTRPLRGHPLPHSPSLDGRSSERPLRERDYPAASFAIGGWKARPMSQGK